MVCRYEETPIMFMALYMIPSRSTPKNAPTRDPLPPSKVMPPYYGCSQYK